jgi:hypothetical protein
MVAVHVETGELAHPARRVRRIVADPAFRARFHESLGHSEVTVGAWAEAGDGAVTRETTFTSPVRGGKIARRLAGSDTTRW